MQGFYNTIPSAPDYEIDQYGNLRNRRTGTEINARMNAQGFLMSNLKVDDKYKTRSIALLVAEAHLDEDERSPAFDSVIHLDGDRTNCSIDNLMWRPRWFVIRYHKQFNYPPIRSHVYLVDTDEYFMDLREPSMKYGILERDIQTSLVNGNPVWPVSYEFRYA